MSARGLPVLRESIDPPAVRGGRVHGLALAGEGARRLEVAYIVTQYPKVSHSFIRREIHALERLGVEVLRLSVRGWDAELVDADDVRERERTHYVLRGGLAGLVAPVLRQALREPARFVAALGLALRMARGADRPMPYHLVYFAEACWISNRLRRTGVTHLHAHFGTNSTEVAMLASVLSGLPFSFTAHGPDEFDMPKSIGLAEKIRRSAFAVAISSFGRSQMLRWTAESDWDKVRVVHCGIDRAFRDVPDTPLPASPRLVCVGRLAAQKGQLLLVEAMACLAREGVAFELVLAGDGEMRREIEDSVVRHGLGTRVRITGWIDGAAVRREIEAARAFVLPSFAEGIPVAIMEAMALRRPIVSTYVAGIPELVVPGEHGWLVPAGSVADLATALRACLAMPDPALRAMGERARERVLQRHDIDHEASILLGLLGAPAGAIADRRGPGA